MWQDLLGCIFKSKYLHIQIMNICIFKWLYFKIGIELQYGFVSKIFGFTFVYGET